MGVRNDWRRSQKAQTQNASQPSYNLELDENIVVINCS